MLRDFLRTGMEDILSEGGGIKNQQVYFILTLLVMFSPDAVQKSYQQT
jgi:hypothetical protein